ncbi:telomere repeat-binding protein 2-like isoform X1 [Iris pallida]|uniref:Telomere repeat-binding protein 2-like isoform X1 n=1 Tax=Iris pallida TaxID=29817 RepID=A0AAX6DL69_IRIPA|nr:telomere repeat-binding protein 2-like isoform X1 [Iris pallida]
MVFHKRLDYGSSGYQVPPMPRVPSSARGKRSVRKKIEDKQMCAFNLLATVAGELLSEREKTLLPHKVGAPSSPANAKAAIKMEHLGNEKSFKPEVFDQGSCNESTFGSDKQVRYDSKECSPSPREIAKNARESIVSCEMGEFDTPKKARNEGFYPGILKGSCKLEHGVKTPLHAEQKMVGNVINVKGSEILEDPMDVDSKPPALVSSDSSVEVPIPRSASFPKCGNVIPVDGNDEENSSGCTHPRINTSKAFMPQRIGDRRIRKLLASKFWKVAPTTSKDEELSSAEMKAIYRNRKLCYTRQRTQRCSFKRRKLFERRSVSASNLDIYNEGVSISPKLGGIKMETSDPHASFSAATGASSSTSGQKSSYESGDYHVKLSIKSFKVPELFIEIPENATVGSLKRTVMEAVTAILGGGLRVGVVHQGKKVRDDNKTLLQAGISHNDKMDNLGFTLEPNSTPTPPPLLCAEDPNPIIPNDVTEQLKRTPAAPPTLELLPAASALQAPHTSTLNCPESDHDSVHSPTDVSSVDKTADSKALVTIQPINVEPLAVVPLRKLKNTDLVQRRIRRPFSVSEVEALVQAVEKLGTGRWRDVKLRAFDNAKHRTYVDLKDKWKTLVHTARISPQQRRGEPVPQELLDRVLSAHAYWSQQQAKLQAKPPPAEACLLA